MAKVVKAREFESLEEAEARRERVIEEAEELTGFDVLLRDKKANLDKMFRLIQQHPEMSRQELADALGVSIRTLYRYGAELRKVYKKAVLKTSLDEQIKAKKLRIVKLRKLIREHPEYSRQRLCKELKVSWRTLYSYLAELEKV